MNPRRVAITGLGIVSPFGGTIDEFFNHLMEGRSAVRHLLTEDLPQPVSMPFVSCVDFDPATALGKPLAGMMERFSHLAVAAGLAAWQDAGLPVKALDPDQRKNWMCIWGTALGGLLAFEKGYRDVWQNGKSRLSPMSVVMGMNNAAHAHLSMQLGLGGLSTTHTVACASSAIAIGEAFHRVRSGEACIALTGGSEAPQAYSVAKAWEAMRLIAPGNQDTSSVACRPFSSDRAGLVLGEGGIAMVLEEWDHAKARGALIHCEMIGYGASSDHSHLVRPDAAGQARALKAALDDAGINADEVGYVNAHGTATVEGDPIEIDALRSVFADHAKQLAVSATKSMHGHLLGAAGAIEALVTVMALREQAIPPTAHLQGRLDPNCHGVDHVFNGRTQVPLRTAISNSFAFGGSNAVLAFRASQSD